MSKQIEPHVLQFYQPKKLLGSGAYGHVWKVIDKRTKQTLALKKIFDAFQNSTDAQRTYREISLLHQMQHKNIIKLHKVIKAANKRDLYLVFEHMQSDLHSLVGESILTASHMTFILYQILKALKYMHSAQLLHRDLKPSNVLINSECEIKICDFGLARSLAHEEHQENILSEEVATRWYRSPEMLLSSKDYGKPTDVWSVGCIVAQLLIGEPIFPGNSTLNQLEKIVQFTGMPSKQNVDSLHSDVAQSILNNLNVRKRPVKDYFRKCNQQSAQLIKIALKMLDFNPSKRPSIEELLQNDIFLQFSQHVNQEEQVCQKFIAHEVDDNIKLTLQEYRKIIYKDIERRYPEFNDASRIKNIFAARSSNSKKHKSLMEKDKKKEESIYHSHSFISKSLPKTADNSASVSTIKKTAVKKESTKSGFQQQVQTNTEYLNSKFYKLNHKQSDKQKQAQDSISQLKQLAKPNNFFNQTNDTIKEFVPKKQITKTKKQSKEPKQVSPCKKPFLEQDQKAQVYKNELKKMKSTKNLIKTKILKPKFEKAPVKLVK